ncbi:MAG TPA: type IV pilus twitching motility protein PilT [Armatimonadota bacterium]
MDLKEVIRTAAERKASDVFLKANMVPAIRVNGSVEVLDLPPVSGPDLQTTVESLMSPEQLSHFKAHHEMDLAFDVDGVCRVRANLYQQRHQSAMVMRLVPLQVMTLEELGLPPVLKELAACRQGLILVTGPTGCGKSTTLAAMVDLINRTRRCNIVTVEDPVEFVYDDQLATVSQREVGIDTDSFTAALRHVVRQSPDVILIGEMRDTETMNVALQASETGHLVFSTVHTASAGETLERIVNMFPPHEKNQICLRMAGSLRGVVSQKLLPRADGKGRVAACEILVATPTVSKLVEEGRSSQLHAVMAEGGFYGMQTLNQCLARYAKAGLITEEEALFAATTVTELKQLLRR